MKECGSHLLSSSSGRHLHLPCSPLLQEAMGSRRNTRSSFSDGRSSSGEDSNGSGRPNGCSYISNVRPENRSTLCTMMAQLAEETQPLFETTLKSKAVSENCNVKFSCVVTGHPAPQIIWYKEDVQLDRYCGLPKYEIFHNGHHHSLHIYNCTLEDAAIYQASASNNKGIVSCSGVLEVGEMNEFKIHQRYFAKLKQKSRRRKEEEGKENLELLRTISPDRTLRKRRSTAEGFLTVPSSMEDEGTDEARQAVDSEKHLEETLVPISNGVSPVIDGQTISENGAMSGTHDSAQKSFTAHQPKTPFTKKIKISQAVKSDTKGEGSQRDTMNSEEVMEVDNTFTSVAAVGSRNETNNQKGTELLTCARSVDINGASGAPQLTGSRAATGQTAAEGNRPPPEETSPKQKLLPDNKTAMVQQSAAAPRPSKAKRTEDARSKPSTAAPESRSGLQRGRAGDEPCEKESGPRQKNLCEGRRAPPREVAQGHTKMSRNDAPVSLEVPLNHRSAEAQPPQKLPSNRDTPAGDVGAPAVSPGPPAATGKMVKDTWDHSRGSNESHTVPFPERQKPSLQNPGTGGKSRGCKVSPSTRHGQVDTTIKTVKETEKHVSTKVDSTKVGEPTRSKSKKIEMETEGVGQQQTKEENVKCATDTEKKRNVSVKSEEQAEADALVLKSAEKTGPSRTSTTAGPAEAPGKTPQLQETHQTALKVISIAELLRSQIKALDSMLENSVAVTTGAGFLQEPDSTEPPRSLKGDDGKRVPEVRTSNRKIEDMPLRNIKETLLEVYQQLQLDQKQLEIPDVVLERIPPRLEINKQTCEPVSGESGTLPPVTPVISAPGSNIPGIQQVKDQPDQDKHEEIQPQPSPVIKEEIRTENEASEELLDQPKQVHMENNEFLKVQKVLTEGELVTHFPANGSKHQDRSVDGFPQTDSSASLSPKTRRNRPSPIPAATEQELASGARRKVPKEKSSFEEASEAPSPVDNQVHLHNPCTDSPTLSSSPSLQKRSQVLQPPTAELLPSLERRSPAFSRRKVHLENPTPSQKTSEEAHIHKAEENPVKKKHDPFKAPQVIRKIRSETFADASGHLKLWCQFFNVLADSTIRWFRNEEEVAQVKRSAGDEAQANLAVVQASHKDSGVYRCTITNEHGTDSTDCLLSGEVLKGMSIREDLGVGEEVEMTPMIFSKGVADSGVWGNKFFGRVVMQESHVGNGCSHKVWRAKVIYGLEPVFESGNTCIIKARNYVPYGGKGERCLTDKNLEMITQECKIQNLAREYCKIFSAEARVIDNFGPSLEVLPVYLMYRPANVVPYVTVEADVPGDYQRYSVLDHTGSLHVRTGSDVEQKCCALQHWIFQWTNGNMLLTRLEGADMKITNVGISVKSSGHQGLCVEGTPKVLEGFVLQHRCNYFCGLLGLRSLKVTDSLMTAKPKASKSPLLQRKMAADSSPQMGRKAPGSPRLTRRTEQEGRKTAGKQPPPEGPAVRSEEQSCECGGAA